MNLEDQIKCVARELAMRRNVYPKWVSNGKMTQEKATWETEAMSAVVETLKAMRQAEP